MQPGIIFYVVLIALALLFMKMHNGLLVTTTSETLHSLDLTPRDKAIVYLVLMGGTLLLMSVCAGFSWPSPQRWWIAPLAIIVTIVASFWLITTLHALLGRMKQNQQLSYDLLFQQDFWLTAYLIIFTELTFLNWLKEVTTYFQQPFLGFVIGYSIIIWIAGFLISRFSQRSESVAEWSYVWIAVIDSLMVVMLSTIFLHLTLGIILLTP
ncbi:MAG: hypothetical protein BWK78_05575 [Thiotrichaceae bacterium IS1]|nr:MAG: hypothetical protein BWK78_05575 [Thiotrichaceae bacterium IS1]